MPKELPNVYENVKEAMLRLRRTVVLYDGQPYVVVAITNHKADGIFRIYLDPTGKSAEQIAFGRPDVEQFPPEHPGVGTYLDEWITSHPAAGVIRKQMNSPLFNRFRPYPLGMCNVSGGGTYYVERQPNRRTEQGLLAAMLQETVITVAPGNSPRTRLSVELYGKAFKDCVMGVYPTAQTCLVNLSDPDILNEAAAFHREFALVRGPLSMLFLAYRNDVIGVLPKNDFTVVRLGRDFHHCREVVENLGVFSAIAM